MIARPMLFSTAMVKALLEGRKSQTRRVMNPQPEGEPRPLSEWSSNLAHACHDHSPDADKLHAHSERLKGRIFPFTSPTGGLYSPMCPLGRPGDLLYVRETWQTVFERSDGQRFTEARPGVRYRKQWIEYAATSDQPPPLWRPSIHMPRKYSRLTLRVNELRAECLQDISEVDAIAEGIYRVGNRWEAEGVCATPVSAVDAYRALWERINGRGSWTENPWCWALTFSVEKRNVDEVLREVA